MQVVYRRRQAAIRLEVPNTQDWTKVADFIAGQLFPQFNPTAPDPVFDQIMKERYELQAKKAAARDQSRERKTIPRAMSGNYAFEK